MKKFLALAILSMSAITFVPSIQAKTINATANSASEPQIRIQLGRNRRNNVRTVRTYTRNVREGRRVYRETYRVVTRPNGVTKTTVVSRVLIRG